MNHFKSYRDSIFIKNHLICKHIIAGDYSYDASGGKVAVSVL
jgi:hypothetical protein